MPMVCVRFGAAVIVFAALCSSPPPAMAFGLHLGPLSLGLPLPGLRRHGPVARRSGPDTAESPSTGADRLDLLYPVLVWPVLYDDMLLGDTSYWPFGYESIFDQAFSKYAPKRAAELCPYRDTTAEIVMRISREIKPTAAQKPLLQNLAAALGQANGYLIKSCPSELPPQPVARLQLMDGQIDATIMALEIIRPPLQKFEQSLDDKQRARWVRRPTAGGDGAAFCQAKPKQANWPLPQLEQAVQPTDAQRKALATVADAFKRAADDLGPDCQALPPGTPSERLDAIENRLDATWRAVQTIEVALADFLKGLSDEQKARIDALEIASAR
jgi:hypothetical protein